MQPGSFKARTVRGRSLDTLIVRLVVLVCVMANGPGLAAGNATPQGNQRAIGLLLSNQATAFERFDVDAYIATFVPERREAERRIFLRSRLLPLTAMHIAAVDSDPHPSADGERQHLVVELTFRLDGQPSDNPFTHALKYSFSRTDGVWLTQEIIDDGKRPLPWRQGELEVHRTNHFLIYTRPEMRADLVDLAADTEAGYATLYRRRLPLASGYVVHFVGGREFARLSGGLPALGVAVARQRMEADRFLVDSRAFYINATFFSERHRRRLSSNVRRVTVAHELVHLALAAESRPFTPPWLKEGAAVYYSEDLSFDANRRLVRGGMDHLNLAAMTRARTLGQHGLVATAGQQAADEYLFSGNVVAYLVEKHGQDRFLAFYGSYAELSPDQVPSAAFGAIGLGALTRVFESASGGLAAQATDDALQRIYGLTLIELEAEVKEWLRIPHR